MRWNEGFSWSPPRETNLLKGKKRVSLFEATSVPDYKPVQVALVPRNPSTEYRTFTTTIRQQIADSALFFAFLLARDFLSQQDSVVRPWATVSHAVREAQARYCYQVYWRWDECRHDACWSQWLELTEEVRGQEVGHRYPASRSFVTH